MEVESVLAQTLANAQRAEAPTYTTDLHVESSVERLHEVWRDLRLFADRAETASANSGHEQMAALLFARLGGSLSAAAAAVDAALLDMHALRVLASERV